MQGSKPIVSWLVAIHQSRLRKRNLIITMMRWLRRFKEMAWNM